MKKHFILFLVLLSCTFIFTFAAFANGSGESGKKTVLKFGHLANEDHTWHKAALKFKELVEQKTSGQVEVQVYPNEQLGKEVELLNGIQAGTVDITITGESMQNFNAPLTALLGVPYLIEDSAHLQKVMTGQPGQEISKQIEENLNFYPLAYFERAPRNLTSNRPISSPNDLNGLILRVPSVPLFVTYWQAVGAKPTPMAFSEVFTSLQQGTIEGQENPLDLIFSANFFEVQNYVNETEHVIGWIYVVMGKKKLESLPQEIQNTIIDAGKEMQTYEHALFLEEQEQFRQKLIDRGMEFNSVDKAAFQKVADDVMFDALTDEQKKVYAQIKDLL